MSRCAWPASTTGLPRCRRREFGWRVIGFGGHRYFFVHPAGTGGVLLELVGE